VLSDGATLLDPHKLTNAMTNALIEIWRATGLSEGLSVVERGWHRSFALSS
jgi:diacylglycerol O-acyltransferase